MAMGEENLSEVLMAAMELFLFVSVYQKELLALLDKNSVFSLRFHNKNNDLIYKSKNRSVIKYFSDLSEETGKEIIEQTLSFKKFFSKKLRK